MHWIAGLVIFTVAGVGTLLAYRWVSFNERRHRRRYTANPPCNSQNIRTNREPD